MTRVKVVEFSVLSPMQIKKLSCVEITRPELYDADGYPVEHGIVDPRMGVVDPGVVCRTCGSRLGECMGHFGHIELIKPVIHPVFAAKIYAVIQAVCHKCGKITAPEDAKGAAQCAKKRAEKCPHCGEKQHKIRYEKPTSYYEGGRQLTVDEIRARFERIPEEELKRLRFKGGRPEWMIITILPVPPITDRPSIVLDTGERSEDDLTHKLVDIVRINERLKKSLDIGAPEFLIEDIIELLQYHVATYIKNDLANVPPARHRSGRPLKTLAQRLIGKEGRFRFNLTGKRVNFSARSVISPDNFIDIDEVGIPEVIARTLTVPEKVTEQNLEDIRKFITNAHKYPGANYVIRIDGLKKKITEETKEMISQEIMPGYTVERHLMDGDWVIFNRQPSLHRMSMMGHRARIMPGKTFRLHLCATTPYNADFDGDEMNLHVVQTEEARAEIKSLLSVEKHIRTPRYGLPIIGAKQDHLMGLFFLTHDKVTLTKQEVSNLAFTLNVDVNLDKDTYTGKEVFSMLLLPPDMNYKGKTKTNEEVLIEDGLLKKGYIDVKAIGSEHGGLLNKINLVYGDEIGGRFLNNLVKLSLLFLTSYNYTISINDYNVDAEGIKDMQKIIKKRLDKFVQSEGAPEEQGNLERILTEVEAIVKEHLPKESYARVAAETGARGNMVSVAQITGCLGQEKLKGSKITRGYYGRVLPFFKLHDVNPSAYGFVRHGYREGLTPIEFFFDAMHGREGLSDTALKTKHSGYLERRLVNSLHDLKIKQDGTVRDETNRIVQFVPFENNINPYRTNKGKISMEDLL